jgi:hypothetical protein
MTLIQHGMDDPGRPILALPWIASSFSAVKGILHMPQPFPTLQPEMRDALLTAIAGFRVDLDLADVKPLGKLGALAENAPAPCRPTPRSDGKISGLRA